MPQAAFEFCGLQLSAEIDLDLISPLQNAGHNDLLYGERRYDTILLFGKAQQLMDRF